MTSRPLSPGRPFAALTLAAAALLATACGPSSSARQATVAELMAAAPTSGSVNLDVAGATSMSLPTAVSLPGGAPLTSTAAATNVMATDLCHPHLFSRTAEVAWRVNGILYRHLRHVDALLARNPDLVAGDSATWADTGSGLEVQRQFTISRSADGLTYTYELDLAPAGQTPPTWVKVFSGTLTDTILPTGRDRAAAMTFDFDALHGVLPAEPLTGQVQVDSQRVKDSTRPAPGVKRNTTVTFVAFTFGPTDPHGPRAGTYTHVSEPGLGGAMAFQDSLVLLCPANPDGLLADAVTHSRWYVAPTGVHGRADARASAGRIPAGQTWLGVTCYQGVDGQLPMATAETAYWAMKLEDATGATVAGSASSAGSGAAACDPAFGAVPSLTDDATDYDFAAPVSFPTQW